MIAKPPHRQLTQAGMHSILLQIDSTSLKGLGYVANPLLNMAK